MGYLPNMIDGQILDPQEEADRKQHIAEMELKRDCARRASKKLNRKIDLSEVKVICRKYNK